jgi:hypothetical protein
MRTPNGKKTEINSSFALVWRWVDQNPDQRASITAPTAAGEAIWVACACAHPDLSLQIQFLRIAGRTNGRVHQHHTQANGLQVIGRWIW